ncbi:MAG: NlpC/P60 family protein [Actinomycetota bacterium]|nr:NlpC/P60 family protein [Actinomycetota bacterium]
MSSLRSPFSRRAVALLLCSVVMVAAGCEAPPPPVADPLTGHRNGVGCPGGQHFDICERSASAARSDTAARAIKFALSQVGVPYSSVGRFGPSAYDCSGLVWQSYAAAGVDIGANLSSTIVNPGGPRWSVPIPHVQPGDVLWYPGHVAIALADGRIVEAAKPGTTVRVVNGTYRGFSRAVAVNGP